MNHAILGEKLAAEVRFPRSEIFFATLGDDLVFCMISSIIYYHPPLLYLHLPGYPPYPLLLNMESSLLLLPPAGCWSWPVLPLCCLFATMSTTFTLAVLTATYFPLLIASGNTLIISGGIAFCELSFKMVSLALEKSFYWCFLDFIYLLFIPFLDLLPSSIQVQLHFSPIWTEA